MSTIETLLHSKQVSVPPFESELLLAHALKKTRTFVIAHPEYPVTEKREKLFLSLARRRSRHEPVALITGHKEFYGREFLVNEHTLVPRPETELLVEKLLDDILGTGLSTQEKRANAKRPTLVLDIGTGSGNIITTIVKELEANSIDEKKFTFVASDLSREALLMARKNSSRHGARKNIRFVHSDLLKKLPKRFFYGATDMCIAANLPYLSEKEFLDAPVDIRMFEPALALESGADGLDHYRKLFEELRTIFQNCRETSARITIFIEISPSQKARVSKLVADIFPNATQAFFKDISKKWRLAKIVLVTSPHARRKT